MNVLIIEDERAAALALTRLLHECRPETRILATLDSVSTSEAWLREPHLAPDLIFMDIHLADGSSFELFRRLPITCPVIFITAYDQYALEAFHTNGIDYLLKPLLKAQLERSLEKFDALRRHYATAAQAPALPDLTNLLQTLQQLASAPVYKSSWLVHYKSQLVPVSAADVAYFAIRNGLVFLTTTSQQEYEVEQTLDELETIVDPRHFFRGSRQVLFARRSVSALEPHFNSRLLVRLTPSPREEVIISKARAADLKNWLNTG